VGGSPIGASLSPSLDHPLGVPEEGEVTIVVLPDIQWYSLTQESIALDRDDDLQESLAHFDDPGDGPRILRRMHEWIVENRDAQRIVFVSFMGDLVERGGEEGSIPRWELARRNIDILHEAGVPYGLAVGNHDMETTSGDTSLFQAFFGAERYRAFPWYVESHRDNVNSAQRVQGAGAHLLFVHLTCNSPDEDLAWADDLLRRFPEDHAFVSTHMLLGPVRRGEGGDTPLGLMEWTKCYGPRGNDARTHWEALFSRHPHLVAVFSGDQSNHQATHLSLEGEAGNTVHLLMSDYKQISREGYLRLLRYHPEERRIRVITWSPTLDRILERTETVPDPGRHNFQLLPLEVGVSIR